VLAWPTSKSLLAQAAGKRQPLPYKLGIITDELSGNFEQALDFIEDACAGLLEVARRRATQVATA